MSTFQVVLGLAKMPVPEKIEFSRFIVSSMTGNANFPTPGVPLAQITTALTALETAHVAAKGGGKDETATMHVREHALDLLLKSQAGYVEGIANNNPTNGEAIILGAGMKVKKRASQRPNGFRIETGDAPGQVKVQSDSEPRSITVCEVTTTPDDEASWRTVHSGTKARFLVTGLESGKRHYFRVAKIGMGGQGPWSNVLNIIVA